MTILAETAVAPENIDKAEAQAEIQAGEKLWNNAGDNAAQYDEAVALTRKGEEKLASAEGRSL